MKVELCNFSGQKIYPSKGKLYVRGDSKVRLSPAISARLADGSSFLSTRIQVFRFISSKSESLFLQRKNPRKIAWTVVYRRMHKKGLAEEVAKKRSRKNVKAQRGIVGADLASILARRNAKPEVRNAARQAAITKAKEEKRAKEQTKQSRPKGTNTATSAPKQTFKGSKGGRQAGGR
ncbi:hypothetical protein QFC21_000951 [Naganishia friedmannii]|uniref:Uncharacterized protein n=1 Tax=Naganishia friedmannii TaxID=89922 RepID=A0ACC2W7V5_9TREE|nr:hypothetical protein QFC21_000951 [Naganishia friedmannii]